MEELREENKPKNPKLLSEDNIKFRIPLYQRPFSWEVQQVRQLLDDLYNQFKSNEENNKMDKYYIGIISLGKTDEYKLYELIDGQQRIITLILIGSILSLYENGQNYNGEKSNWNKFIKDRIEFYGREGDKNLIEHLSNISGKLENKTIKEVITNKVLNANTVLIDALQEIEDFLIEKENEENNNDVSEFSRYVFDNTSFFLTLLPEDYTVIEKNRHFVRMNNRGKQLELHDILKIKLANKLNDEKGADFINDWNEISQLGCDKEEENDINNNETKEDSDVKTVKKILLEDSYSQKELKEKEIYYQSILSFPEFLLIALRRFLNNENETKGLKTDTLLEEFGFGSEEKEWNWNEQDDVLNFLEKLKKQYDIFDRYFIKRDKQQNKQKYEYKFRVENYFHDNTEAEKNTEAIKQLSMFQSYLFVSREKHHWLVKAFNDIEKIWGKNNGIICPENMLNNLKEIDNDRALKLIENHLESEYEDSKMLNFSNRNLRYWFWRLDYYLWEKRDKYFDDQEDKEIVDNYIFSANRSREHIAPQNPKENSGIKIEEPFLHAFGNLSMISSAQNSKLQNNTFEVKKAYVESFKGKDSGSIESLKLLKAMEEGYWEEDKIKKHHNEMIDVLKDSFPDDKKFVMAKYYLENCKFKQA